MLDAMPEPKQTQISTQYPPDPTAFKTVYSNHVNISHLPEEVYLDFCNIEIQAAAPSDVQKDGMLTKVPAIPHTRVILSRAHAKRLAWVLQQAFGQQPTGE